MDVETQLNEWAHAYRNRKSISIDLGLQHQAQLPEVWDQLTQYRNDIDHAGMRQNPTPANKLIENIESICKKVLDLF